MMRCLERLVSTLGGDDAMFSEMMTAEGGLADTLCSGDYAKSLMYKGTITRRAYFEDQAALRDGTLTELHCHDLSKDELKDELSLHRLKTTGNKTELRERLQRQVRRETTDADKGPAPKKNETSAEAFAKAGFHDSLSDQAAMLHAESASEELHFEIYSFAWSVSHNWRNGREQQAEAGAGIGRLLLLYASTLVTAIERQERVTQPFIASCYNLLRALDDARLEFEGENQEARYASANYLNDDDGPSTMDIKGGRVMLGGVGSQRLRLMIAAPWSLLALRAASARTAGPMTSGLKKVLKDAEVRGVDVRAWLTLEIEGKENNESSGKQEGERSPKRKRVRTIKAAEAAAAAEGEAWDDATGHVALEAALGAKLEWQGAKLPKKYKRPHNAATFDGRFDGPKHRRAGDQWYVEEVMPELDRKLDAEYYKEFEVDEFGYGF